MIIFRNLYLTLLFFRVMKSVREILKVYKSSFFSAKKLKFYSVEKQDVYNITAPFRFGKKRYILGRVEPRDIELGARVYFFTKKKNSDYWVPDKNCQVYDLQDPFICCIGETFVLGGVEVQQRSAKKHLSYRTVFYRGKDIHNLRRFATGPWGMKGIRLVELNDGKIGVFTRPQGKKGGLGRIGFTTINSLNELKPRKISNAELIRGLFVKGEWGGVNEVHYLCNGKLGVLGHVARFSKDKKLRFYYPMVFGFDIEKRKATSIRILVRRAELPEGEAKRPDLYNVVYPGGLVRNGAGAKLYVGVGDAEAYSVSIKDPFIYYEKNFC